MKQYWQRANFLPVRPLGEDGRLVTGGAAHCALAQKIAEEGVILAKNEGVLPLPRGAKLAVFGKVLRSRDRIAEEFFSAFCILLRAELLLQLAV